jgi:hypothetical protein
MIGLGRRPKKPVLPLVLVAEMLAELWHKLVNTAEERVDVNYGAVDWTPPRNFSRNNFIKARLKLVWPRNDNTGIDF